MIRSTSIVLCSLFLGTACGSDDGASPDAASERPVPTDPGAGEATDDHAHGPGDDHAHEGDDHAHAEEPIGTMRVGDLDVELAQGHGGVAAGKESHLVVKLPYTDDGDTIVRAWIGTQDRTLSLVSKGEYAPGHDDYDVHVVAPDPLPEGALWWVEVHRPDGTREVGSAEPLLE